MVAWSLGRKTGPNFDKIAQRSLHRTTTLENPTWVPCFPFKEIPEVPSEGGNIVLALNLCSCYKREPGVIDTNGQLYILLPMKVSL